MNLHSIPPSSDSILLAWLAKTYGGHDFKINGRMVWTRTGQLGYLNKWTESATVQMWMLWMEECS